MGHTVECGPGMTRRELLSLLQQVAAGELSPEEALSRLQRPPVEDLGFAQVDLHRSMRQGFPEVIYGSGKTPEQIVEIARRVYAQDGCVLVTRLDAEQVKILLEAFPEAQHHPLARCVTIQKAPPPKRPGYIAVLSAGTSDIPVAEEAAVTAEVMGNHVERIYDVGVAGLHRLLGKLDRIQRANVLIVVAGMEGALPSVVAGLVARPVIAVPTSVGYGASFGGVAALLGMLNSCGSGVVVVNIDNGFGAGFAASQINALVAGEQ